MAFRSTPRRRSRSKVGVMRAADLHACPASVGAQRAAPAMSPWCPRRCGKQLLRLYRINRQHVRYLTASGGLVDCGVRRNDISSSSCSKLVTPAQRRRPRRCEKQLLRLYQINRQYVKYFTASSGLVDCGVRRNDISSSSCPKLVTPAPRRNSGAGSAAMTNQVSGTCGHVPSTVTQPTAFRQIYPQYLRLTKRL